MIDELASFFVFSHASFHRKKGRPVRREERRLTHENIF